MTDEFSKLTLDKPPPNEIKNIDQLRRHSVDIMLESKPTERALHLLMVGDEVQKLSVVNSLPKLLAGDGKGSTQKLIPKMNQGLLQGSFEYLMAANDALQTIIKEEVLRPDQIAQNFLHSLLICIDNRNVEVSRAWFETLLEFIAVVPLNVLHREVLPAAVSKSELSKPVSQRIMSCKMLGRIANRFDAFTLKKDVFPLMQALTQDTNRDIRAAICLELPLCASVLEKTIDKDILPLLNELANDDEVIVKIAAYQAMVDIMPFMPSDMLSSQLVPLAKKMIEISLLPGEDEMKIIVTKHFGKTCIAFQSIMGQQDKIWMLERFTKFSQLGVQKHLQSRKQADMYLECRLNCAFNIPAVLQFSSDLNTTVITATICPIICSLASDTYFLVRRSISAGLHEVVRILAIDNNVVIPEVIKLLKDDVIKVLESLVPILKLTMESFCESKTLTPDYVDETSIELAKALHRCESKIESTYDWRLHSTFIEQLEVLPKCLPSDFIYTQFVPLVYKRIFSCRTVPCRLAAVKTTLVFLRYILKPSQRTEIRNKIINDLCGSPSFYDRVIFARSCTTIIELFSSNYFREFFFAKAIQLTEDKVANIRLIMYALMPKLKDIAKGADKAAPKFLQMIDNAMQKGSSDKDPDVADVVTVTNAKLIKLNNIPYKKDPKDAQKFEEEKHLATLTGTGAIGAARGPEKRYGSYGSTPIRTPLIKTRGSSLPVVSRDQNSAGNYRLNTGASSNMVRQPMTFQQSVPTTRLTPATNACSNSESSAFSSSRTSHNDNNNNVDDISDKTSDNNNNNNVIFTNNHIKDKYHTSHTDNNKNNNEKDTSGKNGIVNDENKLSTVRGDGDNCRARSASTNNDHDKNNNSVSSLKLSANSERVNKIPTLLRRHNINKQLIPVQVISRRHSSSSLIDNVDGNDKNKTKFDENCNDTSNDTSFSSSSSSSSSRSSKVLSVNDSIINGNVRKLPKRCILSNRRPRSMVTATTSTSLVPSNCGFNQTINSSITNSVSNHIGSVNSTVVSRLPVRAPAGFKPPKRN